MKDKINNLLQKNCRKNREELKLILTVVSALVNCLWELIDMSTPGVWKWSVSISIKSVSIRNYFIISFPVCLHSLVLESSINDAL